MTFCLWQMQKNQRRAGWRKFARKLFREMCAWNINTCPLFLFLSLCLILYRIHTGETPYRCTYCDKKFTRKERLTYHIRWALHLFSLKSRASTTTIISTIHCFVLISRLIVSPFLTFDPFGPFVVCFDTWKMIHNKHLGARGAVPAIKCEKTFKILTIHHCLLAFRKKNNEN